MDNISALFFDIDGTLVSFKTHQIPRSTVEAIAKAKENGVGIYISTGRPLQIITNLKDIEPCVLSAAMWYAAILFRRKM